MAYSDTILQKLWNTTLSYNGLKVNIFGVPYRKEKTAAAFRMAVHRLRKSEYIKETSEGYTITTKGRKYVEKKLQRFKTFDSNIKSTAKNLLVLFDIPETQKAEREWFRWHLKKFGYVMIQKSVWLGPSPLPKDFVAYTKSIGLDQAVKTFRVTGHQRP